MLHCVTLRLNIEVFVVNYIYF